MYSRYLLFKYSISACAMSANINLAKLIIVIRLLINFKVAQIVRSRSARTAMLNIMKKCSRIKCSQVIF